MTHDTAREHTKRFVDSAERRLESLIGFYVEKPGVRAELESLAIKCFESGSRRHELTDEERTKRRVNSQDVTPLHNPRVAREVNATRPVRGPRGLR